MISQINLVALNLVSLNINHPNQSTENITESFDLKQTLTAVDFNVRLVNK